MSVSQLFQPNNYDLFCRSINAENLTPMTPNMVVQTTSTEIEFPASSTTADVLPRTITPNSASSKIKISLVASLRRNIQAGNLLSFTLYRLSGDDQEPVEIGSFEFAAGATVRIDDSLLINWSMIDESPNTTTECLYYYDIDNTSNESCYLSFFNRTTIQTVLTEI